MKSMSVKDVRKHLGDAIRDAEAGGTTVITRYGKPVATLAPVQKKRPKLPDMEPFRQSVRHKGPTLSQVLLQMRREERA